MDVGREKARKLLTEAEFRIYEASATGRVDDHGAARLGQLLTAARRLRDKYGRVASQQRAEARGKRDPKNQRVAQGDDNTRLKHDIFASVIERLEAARARAQERTDPNAPAPSRRAIKAQKRASGAAARKAEAAAPAKKKAKKKVAKKRVAKKKAAAKKAITKKTASKPTAAKKRVVKKKAKKKAAKKKVSALAHDAKRPVGAKKAQKPQVAAQKAQLAHGAARGRRNQARKDAR